MKFDCLIVKRQSHDKWSLEGRWDVLCDLCFVLWKMGHFWSMNTYVHGDRFAWVHLECFHQDFLMCLMRALQFESNSCSLMCRSLPESPIYGWKYPILRTLIAEFYRDQFHSNHNLFLNQTTFYNEKKLANIWINIC